MSSHELKHFSHDEIYLSPEDARAVLKFFFPDTDVPASLTDDDRGFAQALLLEAIDKSYAMSFTQDLYDVFYGKIPTGFEKIRDMVKDFAKKAARKWFDHATGKDLKDPKIYRAVYNVIAVNFKSVWRDRLMTEQLTY